MRPSSNSSGSTIAAIIENRSPAGPNESVQGWHKLLKRILCQMAPYLIDGHMVTFRRLTDQEKRILRKTPSKNLSATICRFHLHSAECSFSNVVQ